MQTSNLTIVKSFLNALCEGKTGNEITCYYDPAAKQIEYPNLLTKVLTERDVNDIFQASISGANVISKQTIDIIKSYAFDNIVIIESVWIGVLAIQFGGLKPGDKVKAHFAQFYEFKDGKILAQRNYDCFEQFENV